MLRSPEGGGYRASVIGTADLFLPESHAKHPLLRIPRILQSDGKEWMPSSSALDMQNWIQAALALDPEEKPTRRAAYRDDKRRVVLETGVQVCWVPNGVEEGAEPDIKLLVTVNVYLDMTVFFVPLPDIGKDMLGLILHSLIPSPTAATPRSESEARAIGLRHFYACLSSAPDLPLAFHASRLQPKEMVSRLLPFQARTVALLLQREHSPMAGSVKAQEAADPIGFWSIHDLGKEFGRVAFRRVTGDMVQLGPSPTIRLNRKGKGRVSDEGEWQAADGLEDAERDSLPRVLDLSGVRGTMLCEEMGETVREVIGSHDAL